eukprot:TRINITY_DN23522_c0_g2_i1.p1 TRINITY_DN23522_c0_g2~~TRINITY_DN23522_c0_g2_i1.p1  ORF type:complete len:749 (+),score=162.96 TRINITY_DN23522_c0_g2_i1:174-2420(+)
MAAMVPPLPGGLPGTLDISDVSSNFDERETLPRDKLVSVHVNALENALSALLAEYRRGAEDILEQHLENVSSREAAYQMEIATLRAENGVLRDRLGLERTAPTDLMQSVVMHDPHLKKDKGARNDTDDPLGERSLALKAKTKDDKQLAGAKRGRNGEGEKEQVVGGCWQQFVAWVPNGAALGNPEPWKPLADLDLSGMFPQQADEDEVSEAGTKEAYEVLDVWVASTTELNAKRASSVVASVLAKDKTKEDGVDTTKRQEREEIEDEEEDVFHQEQRPGFFIIHPQSAKRIVWDILSLLLVIYDMVMIPMSFFALPETTFLVMMDWVTRLFWTLDMGWSCCTAVVMKNGDVNFDVKYILKRYMKSWFALDVFIVSSDWMEVVLNRFGGGADVGQVTKIFRIVRVVRLLRLVRMQEVMATITERIQSDKLTFFLDIMKSVVFVVAVSHVVGCIWWGIGQNSATSWVSRTSYETADVGTQYLVSLHWSLAQFTGGMGEFVPVNLLERFYAVWAWIFGWVSATIIVSIITSKLTQLYMIGGAQSRQMSTLKKYLKQNDISSNLCLRMVKSAKHAMSGDLTPDAVEMLHVVSEPLKVEMHFEQYSMVLRAHPFFAEYIQEGPYVMRRVCHFANSTLMLANGDIVFSKGENPAFPKMYFVWKGMLEYSISPGEVTPVAEKQWVAEPVLWTKWCHRGTLTATNDVKLVCLDAKVFQEIVDRFKDIGGFDPRVYAADFVRTLNSLEVVNDLTIMR